MLDALEWGIFRSFAEVDLRRSEEFFSEYDFFFIRQLKNGFVGMLIKMGILISTFQQMAVLMLDFSHDFHSSPFIHFISQFFVIGKVVFISFLVLQRVLIKLTSNGLAADVCSDGRLVVDKTLNYWNNVRKLCANIDNQTTLQCKKICWKHSGLVHEQSIELIRLVEKLNQLLPVLFAAQWRLDIEKGVLWRIDKHFFSEGKTCESLEAFPIFDEAVFENGFRVWVFFS